MNIRQRCWSYQEKYGEKELFLQMQREGILLLIGLTGPLILLAWLFFPDTISLIGMIR